MTLSGPPHPFGNRFSDRSAAFRSYYTERGHILSYICLGESAIYTGVNYNGDADQVADEGQLLFVTFVTIILSENDIP
jgi:hypothetical protein